MASRDSMDTADLIGRLVDDRYKVIEPMASGSMGAVYKGERVPVGKQVAIKFLHAAFAHDAEFLTRFERETRVMSKLAHPNCVSVVDFGVFEGSPYIVMDYVAGRTLRSILDEAPLDPGRALAIARQVAAGLAHAHAQGVVHRDIKPANIMISDEIGAGEHARILDFGLARLRGAVGRDATQTNVVVGTPNYMAPEQTVGGGTIDARTDIYAVGVVLFEMIAGQRPFQAEDTLALLGMHRAAPIPKLADRLDRTIILPDGLQAVIEKAMAKTPGDRYQTAIELADAIDELTGAKQTIEPKGKVVHRKRTPAAGISVEHAAGAVASTMLDVKTDKATRTQPIARTVPKRNSTMTGVIVALILLGGGAFAAWYVLKGGEKRSTASIDAPVAIVDAEKVAIGDAAAIALDAEIAQGSGSSGDDSSGSGSGIGDGSGSGSGSEAGSGSAVEAGSGSGSGDTAGSGSGSGSGSGPGSGAGSGSGSGSGSEIEMEPDGSKVEHVGPSSPERDDEVEDAPKKDEEVEKHTPPAPRIAKTIPQALALIREGKSQLAITSLRKLWRSNPKSGYIPFLLGNLYFDKGWWSIALDHYNKAISKSKAYRDNGYINKNVIKMLASPKMRYTAEAFIRRILGRSAVPYLRLASYVEKNAYVKKRSGELYRSMGGR